MKIRFICAALLGLGLGFSVQRCTVVGDAAVPAVEILQVADPVKQSVVFLRAVRIDPLKFCYDLDRTMALQELTPRQKAKTWTDLFAAVQLAPSPGAREPTLTRQYAWDKLARQTKRLCVTTLREQLQADQGREDARHVSERERIQERIELFPTETE